MFLKYLCSVATLLKVVFQRFYKNGQKIFLHKINLWKTLRNPLTLFQSLCN